MPTLQRKHVILLLFHLLIIMQMQLFTTPEMAQAQVAPQATRNTATSPSVKNKSTLSKSRHN
jgi:hypothetical protein